MSTTKRNGAALPLAVYLFAICLALPGFADSERRLLAPHSHAEISDNLAACVFYQAMARFPGVLDRVGLDQRDLEIASAIVTVFEEHFEALSRGLNQRRIKRDDFIRQRDVLVVAARKRVRASLSPAGADRLENYVRQHKGHLIPDYAVHDN